MGQILLLIGPALIATLANAVMYGINLTQASIWYSRLYRRGVNHPEPWPMCALVVWHIMVGTFSVACGVALRHYVFSDSGNLNSNERVPWPASCTPIVTVLASVPIVVRSIVALTIHALSSVKASLQWPIERAYRNASTGVLLAIRAPLVLSLAQGGVGIAVAVKMLLSSRVSSLHSLIPLVDTWLVIAMVCDIVMLVVILYKFRSRCTANVTDHLNKAFQLLHQTVIRYTILTTLSGALWLATFNKWPETNIYLVFALPMGRIYTCYFLSYRNNRGVYRHEEQCEAVDLGISLGESSRQRPTRGKSSAGVERETRFGTQSTLSITCAGPDPSVLESKEIALSVEHV
ncbi:hypothetical protein PUNSTDRAFT_137258 [Punctularia strigosozonata HHB-11173 SS5]|uniref:uncharacterized protein n=1 Tax=Punctularia strigosozonata (strain HHB-11173) TaxID=741275 RepID=UPI000441649E|nr:uncharacterized protein PUNSTDRAFT_137258 [Punctularia strigosozonata HHB-11173 SS5]EIN05766.1 hypothetical protein PUNSTDRAFT_137258 [Punctularia strigosozonata HHB-11173 SS5]